MSVFLDNRQLLDDFRSGTQEALSRVFRTYVDDIKDILRFGFSFESGGRSCRFQGYQNDYDLQDRIQDVFIQAFSEKARLGYDGIRPYKAYLARIARNLVIEEFRRTETRMRHFSFDEVDGKETAPIPLSQAEASPEAASERDELADLLLVFEASLSDNERKVLKVLFREGLSQRRASEELGWTRTRLRWVELGLRKKAWRFFRNTGYLDDLTDPKNRKLMLLTFLLGACKT